MENRGDVRPEAQYRLAWVDVARGIGIIAVVMGHVWTRGPLRDAMYSFHMPLFFLLSGMMSRPHPPGTFVRRQVATQMRPYAAFLILILIADAIIEYAKGGVPLFHRWPADVLPILLGGTWLRGPFTIFWFVPCLLIARILFNMLLARLPDPLDRRWAMVVAPTLALAYMTGYMTRHSPLGLLTVPMAIVLLWAGAAWPRIRWHNATIMPLALLSLVGLAGIVPTLNMKAGDYGLPIMSIAAGIATSLLIFRTSALIPPLAPLVWIGRASLVIMYLHVAVIHYLTPHLPPVGLAVLALCLPAAIWWIMRTTALRRVFL